jgi:hypothetical protein
VFIDPRGSLGVTEFGQIPFVPQRIFWIFGVAEGETRANHGHRECEQLVFVQQGSIGALTINQHGDRTEWKLKTGEWLNVPPRHWLQLNNFEQGTVLGVLASLPYDRAEYIDNPEDLSS